MLAVAAEHELEAIMIPGCRSNPRMAHCVGRHLRGIPRSNALPASTCAPAEQFLNAYAKARGDAGARFGGQSTGHSEGWEERF